MKKILAFILATVMILSMSACNFDLGVSDKAADNVVSATIPTQGTDIDVESNQNHVDSEAPTVNIEPGDGDRETVVGGSNVFMHDNADLLTEKEEHDLITLVAQYAPEMYFNILFLTYDNANGKTTKDYSDDYMDAMFPVGVEDNIAFVIDMDNNEVYINTMGKAILWLDDSDVETALNSGWDYVLKGNWGPALVEIADYSLKIVANGGRD